MKNPRPRRTAPLVIASAAVALSACTAGDPASGAASSGDRDDTRLSVMTSFYPLEYLAQQIGGDLVDVSSLTPPGAEPHDLELSPRTVDQLGRADIAVYLSGFQGAVDEAIEQNPPATVVDVAPEVDLVPASQHGLDEDEESDEEAGQDGHDHPDTDPHFWLDPERMAQAARAVGNGLAQADPDHAQTYADTTDTVVQSLTQLSDDLVGGTANCAHRTFITAHAAFGYLADRTGLTQVGVSGLDPDSAPSPQRLTEIAQVVKDQGVTTIFTEALIDPTTTQTLADDLGITTAVLDPIESQTDPDQDYAAAMRGDIQALQEALSCR